MAINLLPKDIASKNKQTNRGKSLSVVTYVLFVVGLIVIGAGFFIVTSQQSSLAKLEDSQANLRSQVQEYEQQEYQLILVKDRLSSIQEVVNNKSLERVVGLHEFLYESLPPGVTLVNQGIGESDNFFSVQAQSSIAIRDFFETIRNSGRFQQVTINGMNYVPSLGYQVDLEVI